MELEIFCSFCRNIDIKEKILANVFFFGVVTGDVILFFITKCVRIRDMNLSDTYSLVLTLHIFITFKPSYGYHACILDRWCIDFGLILLGKENIAEVIFFIIFWVNDGLDYFLGRALRSFHGNFKSLMFNKWAWNKFSVFVDDWWSLSLKLWSVWLLSLKKDTIASL